MRIGLPEQTWIDYQPASFGSRALAYITDFVIRWTAAGAVAALLVFLMLQVSSGEIVTEALSFVGLKEHSSTVIIAFLMILFFLVEWTYPIYFEVLHDGVTPGKRIFGLRVVDEKGLPISWRASVLRTLLLPVDLMPGMGLAALVSMVLTGRSQRLGDLVAGTLVVYDAERDEKEHAARAAERSAAYLLPLDAYNLLENYLSRRSEIVAEFRTQAQNKVLEVLFPLRDTLPPFKPEDAADPDFWLEQLYRSSRPAKKSYREAGQAQSNSRQLDWSAVERELDSARMVLERLERESDSSERNLFDSAETYQRLCQRYAHLSTFYPQSREARDAARLVRYGRRLIYQRRLAAVKETKRQFPERVGAAMNAVSGHLTLSAAVLFGSGLICAALVLLNPSLGWYFLNEQTAAALSQGRIWTEQIQGVNAAASSGIMRNNISVSFLAFALGITGGVGTMLLLLSNGALLGGIFAALVPYKMGHRLLEFIVAHGVLELSIIVVAAGCGLYFGDALLRPGSLTRARALRERATLVLDLLLFSALCLIPAGITEGYISPNPQIHPLAKLVIGLILGGSYWAFLVWCKAASNGKSFPTLLDPDQS